MPAVEQDRRPAIRCGELEPAGRGLVRRLHLGDHAGKRAEPQRILGQCQHLGILARLGVENALGAEPDLFQPRRIKVIAAQRPQHRKSWLCCEPGGDTGCEQRGGRVVVQRGGGGGYLVEPSPVEATAGNLAIDRFQSERQHRSALALGLRKLRAKRGYLIGTGPIGGQRRYGHRSASTHLFLLCSSYSRDSSSEMMDCQSA